VCVSLMAIRKARGWDYIGIFMLYGFWLCAFLVIAFGVMFEVGTDQEYVGGHP